MKKFLLLTIGLLIGSQSFAQDPDLFQTWYLYRIEIKFSNGLLISVVEPPISPWLRISESLEFEGFGACNSFSGMFEYIPVQNQLNPINFFETTIDCETEFHDAIEDEYFGYFRGFSPLYYYIYTGTDGFEHLVLSTGSPGFELNFVDTSLLVANPSQNEVKIYPNPVSEVLFITSEKILINKISVYSITGGKVLEVINIDNSIDVSALSNGMYFLEIISSEGRTVQKFIKD